MDRTRTLTSASILVIVSILTGCARPEKIVVGSKNFTEQLVLGEILAQQIERKVGVQVERRLNLGGTMLAQQALVAGAIDLYPEYTGTALTAILKLPPEKDPDAVFQRVHDEYVKRYQLEWLTPFGFNNTFAMVVRKADVGAGTLSAASASGKLWRMGVGYEFFQRPDGYQGLVRAYGLKTAGTPVTMDLGLLYTALGGGQVDMVAGNSTDGVLSVIDGVTLTDDRKYFPPYQCATVVRRETLTRYPQLSGVLQKLSGSLSEGKMQRLNYQVDGEHRPLRDVAADFLVELDKQGSTLRHQ